MTSPISDILKNCQGMKLEDAEQAITALLDKAILTTWNYTREGYNGEYDGLTHNGGKRYTVEEVEAKVSTEVKELLGIGGNKG